MEYPLYIYLSVFSKTASRKVFYRKLALNSTIKISHQASAEGSFHWAFPSLEHVLLNSKFASGFPSAFGICCIKLAALHRIQPGLWDKERKTGSRNLLWVRNWVSQYLWCEINSYWVDWPLRSNLEENYSA